MQWGYKVNQAQQPATSLAKLLSPSPGVCKAKHTISPHGTKPEAVS